MFVVECRSCRFITENQLYVSRAMASGFFRFPEHQRESLGLPATGSTFCGEQAETSRLGLPSVHSQHTSPSGAVDRAICSSLTAIACGARGSETSVDRVADPNNPYRLE